MIEHSDRGTTGEGFKRIKGPESKPFDQKPLLSETHKTTGAVGHKPKSPPPSKGFDDNPHLSD